MFQLLGMSTLAALAMTCYASNSVSLSFDAPRGFPAPSEALAVGDFNGDGKLDLVGTSYEFASVSVLLGNGNGTFQPAMNYPLTDGANVRFVATADLNRDGKLDLVVANGRYVSVLLGNGDGTFQTSVSYLIGRAVLRLALADLNGDGVPDLIVSCGTVSVLLGNGDGTFGKQVGIGSGGFSAVGDFNGDGKLDVAITGIQGVEILLGNGDGSFKPPVQYGTASLYALVAGDFNGDGKIDLAGTEVGPSNNRIYIYLGNGDGTFQQSSSYPDAPRAGWIAAGDLNDDGHLDLVTNSGTILLGKGDGTFHKVAGFFDPTDSTSVVVADFNGDGKPDLAVGNNASFMVCVLLGNGRAKFQSPSDYILPEYAGAVAVGDFNKDGNQDLAVATTSAIYILLGNGKGSFEPPVSANAGTSPGFIAVGDFNRDGNLDLAVTNLGQPRVPSTVSILLGKGDGTFQAPVSYDVGINPFEVVAADFNRDGKLDLAVANQVSGTVSILIGNGDGTFQPAVNHSVPVGVNGSAAALASGDLNGDGDRDLVVGVSTYDQSPPASVVILLGNGDGSFRTPVAYSLASPCNSIGTTIGDLNGDGIPDLVVAGVPCVSVLLGNGDGTFQPPFVAANVPADGPGALRDFNSDGNLDLVTVDYYTNAVLFMLGNGDGTFQQPIYFEAGLIRGSAGLAVGDFDRDGKPDVAAGFASAVAILLNHTR
jgi:hypothetical protein